MVVGGKIYAAIGVRDQLRLGGAVVFCPNILSGTPALENSLRRGGGGGGGGGTHAPFFLACAKKVPLWPLINHISCNTRSKRLKRRRKKKLVARKSSGFARILLVTCPKIKCVCLNITCFCPNMATWKILKGLQPPPPPTSYAYVCSGLLDYMCSKPKRNGNRITVIS